MPPSSKLVEAWEDQLVWELSGLGLLSALNDWLPALDGWLLEGLVGHCIGTRLRYASSSAAAPGRNSTKSSYTCSPHVFVILAQLFDLLFLLYSRISIAL